MAKVRSVVRHSMKTAFHFTRLELIFLVTNIVAFSACCVLLMLGKATGPLVLLTIGTFGMLAGKIGKAYFNAREAEPTGPTPQRPTA